VKKAISIVQVRAKRDTLFGKPEEIKTLERPNLRLYVRMIRKSQISK
jgi:hypothetical protein